MTFAKILCPIDFSACSDRALAYAARLATTTGAELRVVHSWFMPASVYPLETPYPAELIQQVADDAQNRLDAAVRTASAAGVKQVKGQLMTGAPWAEIVGLLEREPFDLCVIGTHGRTGLSRVLLGSVAEKVIRHAPCSVLAVHPQNDAKAFTHIVVPTDFSESAAAAADLALRLVHPEGTITLLHVLELPIVYAGDMPLTLLETNLDAAEGELLARTAKELQARTTAKVLMRSSLGAAGRQIIGALDDDPTVDLVVMGSHGRTGITRALLGSVAEKTVRHASCPVLVARRRA